MANITYTPTFRFDPWQDQRDVVAAEGERGFNKRFLDLIVEFDAIAAVVGQINAALQQGLAIQPIVSLSKQLAASQVTDPEEIETYNKADFPGDTRKLYQVIFEPAPGFHGQVSYNLIYTDIPGNRTRVSIWFKNEKTEVTRIVARVFSLS
jgi:hypothetical protein